MQKIVPNLWFDSEAEEAARFYVSIFPNSKLGTISRYGNGDAAKAGRVMQAMLQMKKIDIAGLRRTHEGEGR